MEIGVIGLLAFVILIGLLLCGVWIGVALAVVGIITLFLYGGATAVPVIGRVTYNTLNNYDFAALPLFIFMATVLTNCGVSARLYKAASSLFGRLPGGLLHANIAGCALFASVSGSSTATCAAMSTIAIPELEKRGYPTSVTLGSLAMAGTLGPMIPPSIGFIVYGVLTETSIGKLFMAGIIPGIMLTACFIGYVVVRSLIKKDIKPVKIGPKKTVLDLFSIWPVLFLFLLVLGSIYLGICTASEAGALGCTGAIITAILFKQFTRANLRQALRQGVSISILVFFVILGAMLMGRGLSNCGVPQYLMRLVIAAEFGVYEFLGILTVFYLILGMFFDAFAMMAVTLPTVFPIVITMGIDPIWFGVIMVLFGEMAAVTPPVGVNLFVIQGITGKPPEAIVKGVIPFLLLVLLVEVVLVIWPEIPLILPNLT